MPRGDQLGKATEDHLDPDHFRERKICGRTRLRDLEDARKVVRSRFDSLDLTCLEPRTDELCRALERPEILETCERWKEGAGKG